MPQIKNLAVKDLTLDLSNFRTVPQLTEKASIHAIIQIEEDWFWALLRSLADEGYQPTENVIVLKLGDGATDLVVKEGNRRVGALKLLLGLIPCEGLNAPADVLARIADRSQEWKQQNEAVPCAVYSLAEKQTVDGIVAKTHGYGEQAGRLSWNPVARARHNRSQGSSEPALDLLEGFLKSTKTLFADVAEKWSGAYPLTVLEDAIKRMAPRFGASNSRELVDGYGPKSKYRDTLDALVSDIGFGNTKFADVRDTGEFEVRYKLPPLPASAPATPTAPAPSPASALASGYLPPTNAATAPAAPAAPPVAPAKRVPKAIAGNDPASINRVLRKFAPRGANREKLVTLLNEAKTLRVADHPHAFCFLLRSMFEISAKAYCIDHQGDGLSATKNGRDKELADLLRDVTNHLTKHGQDKTAVRTLHGAIAEIAAPDGFLSVTSMNQLVHNKAFSVNGTHIATLFHNIFPLLEGMNR